MSNLVLDLIIVAVLILFAALGWHKGLVLTLCGLVAAFVAYAGASFVSQRFSEDIAVLVQPSIQVRLDQAVESALANSGEPSPSPLLPAAGEQEQPQLTASLEQVLRVLERSPLTAGFYQSVADAVRAGTLRVVTTATAAVAHYLAWQISRAGLFFLTFFLIVTAWALLSRALDLVCRLPVLRSFNEVGGLLLGLVKGALILVVVVGLVTLLGLIPEEVSAQTVLYRRFMIFQFP